MFSREGEMVKPIEIREAGERRFYVKVSDGTGHHYDLERALGKLERRVGCTIERTGFGGIVYIQFPLESKATGVSCDRLSAQDLHCFIAAS